VLAKKLAGRGLFKYPEKAKRLEGAAFFSKHKLG